MRLIDKDDLIKSLGIPEDLECCHCKLAYTYGGCIRVSLSDVCFSIENAEEVGRWIPCSERLPEKDGRYLCTVGSAYRNPREMIYAPQKWEGKSDDAIWRDPSGHYVYDWFVKAWMPLPEPFMQEGEE